MILRNNQLDCRLLWRIWLEKKLWIIVFTALCTLSAVYFVHNLKTQWTATTVISVEPGFTALITELKSNNSSSTALRINRNINPKLKINNEYTVIYQSYNNNVDKKLMSILHEANEAVSNKLNIQHQTLQHSEIIIETLLPKTTIFVLFTFIFSFIFSSLGIPLLFKDRK